MYLPDELYPRAREEELPVSTLAQDAITAALRARSTDEWSERAAGRPPRLDRTIDTTRLMDVVREDFGA